MRVLKEYCVRLCAGLRGNDRKKKNRNRKLAPNDNSLQEQPHKKSAKPQNIQYFK